MTAITGASLVLPTHVQPDGVLILDDEKIVAAGPRATTPVPRGVARVDARGMVLVPGLVDLHINGFGGIDVFDAGRSEMARMGAALASKGTTSFVPTLPTSPFQALCRATAKLAAIVAAPAPAGGAEPLGVYVEGPFLSNSKRGAHPSQDLRAPRADSIDELLAALPQDKHLARIVALAPELPGALDAIRRLTRAGCIVTLAHSDADSATAAAAAAAGAKLVTHLFNAMGPMHHRAPGLAGYTLGSGALCAEIIGDGHHVDRWALALAARAMGPDRLAIVSDALAPAGLPVTDGQFARLSSGLGKIRLRRPSAPGLAPRAETASGLLAGSVASLSDCLRFAVREAGIPLLDAVRMASTTPARIAGAGARKGRLEAGFDADVLMLDADLLTRSVWVRGRLLDSARRPAAGARKVPRSIRSRPCARRGRRG